ncbi:MAG: hypothetical protein ACLFM9_02525 [Candidatus Aenigmatarchaeota archaeon]
MILNLLLRIALVVAALYLGDKIISAKIPLHSLLFIAATGQIFVVYVLPYAMRIVSTLSIPYLGLILELIIWVGAANFVVPKTSPKQYLILGLLAFAANYFVGYFEIVGLLL